MPYNFESTFVTPLLADLDAGIIKGAEDWSTAIVKYYSQTVQAGLPQGVPTTLPAPGLNPTAPPPYPINAIGITNNPNQETMKQLIKAFFLAKEIGNDKMAIDGLVNTVTQLVEKIKVKRQEILELIERIKTLAKEVSSLPEYLKEVVASVKEVIEEDKKRVKDLLDLVTNLRGELAEQINAEDFNRIFKEEINLINTLRNFKIESFEDLKSTLTFIDNTKRKIELFTKTSGNAAGSTNRGIFFSENPTDGTFDIKVYLYSRISEFLTSLEQIASIVVDPAQYLAYLERVRSKSPKFNRLFNALSKVDSVERFVKPEILKLEKQKDQKIAEIKKRIQPKIDDIKKKIEEKTQELLSKRKDGLKDNLYTKTKKRVDEFRKSHAEKIERTQKEIKQIEKALKQLNLIIEKVKTLKASLETEFQLIKSELTLIRENIKNGTYLEKFKDVKDELKKALATKPQIPFVPTQEQYQPNFNDPNNPPRLTTLQIKQDYLKDVERKISGPGDLEQTRELRKKLKTEALEEPTEADAVFAYMEDLGLGEYSQVVLNIVAQSKTTFNAFKILFERRLAKYKTYIEEVSTLIDDINALFDILQEIREGKGPAGKAVEWAARQAASLKNTKTVQNAGRWLEDQATSLKGLLMDLVKRVQPLIDKARSFIQKQYKKAKKYIEQKAAKFQKEIEWYLLNLVPLGSDKKDFETKEIEIKARKAKVEDYKKQVQYYAKLSQAIGKAARGGVDLQKNIFKEGQYSLAANELHIQNIADGIYDYRKLRANNDPTISAALDEEKKELISEMDDLVIIETTIYGLVEFFKVVSNTKGYREDWDKLVDSIQDTSLRPALDALTQVFKNPPRDPRQIITLIEDTLNTQNVFDLLTKPAVIDNLVPLEEKHLGRVRAILKTLNESKLQTAVDNNLGNQGKRTSARVFTFLTELDEVLNKKKSFVKFLLEQLNKYYKKLVLFIKKEVDKVISSVKKYIKRKTKKIKEQFDIQLEKIKEKAVNLEAPAMSITFGLAARAFWTGATWTGPTGTQHTTFTIGQFTPMKALTEDGASGLVREMAKGFEAQLKLMQGLVLPPANTGIPPIPFTGYK